MEALLGVGSSSNIIKSSRIRSDSLLLLKRLNVSKNFGYSASVNNASGNSRKYDLRIPVTE